MEELQTSKTSREIIKEGNLNPKPTTPRSDPKYLPISKYRRKSLSRARLIRKLFLKRQKVFRKESITTTLQVKIALLS